MVNISANVRFPRAKLRASNSAVMRASISLETSYSDEIISSVVNPEAWEGNQGEQYGTEACSSGVYVIRASLRRSHGFVNFYKNSHVPALRGADVPCQFGAGGARPPPCLQMFKLQKSLSIRSVVGNANPLADF
jgi:hypothetical protein